MHTNYFRHQITLAYQLLPLLEWGVLLLPFVNVGSALMNTFTQSKDAILILDGYMMALMHDINSFFYLFDPHARNSFGMSDPNGTAVVYEFGKSQFIPNYLNMRYSPICACAQGALF